MTRARKPTRAPVTTLVIALESNLSSWVVTRARVGFRARVTYVELGYPGTNIDPSLSLPPEKSGSHGIIHVARIKFRGKLCGKFLPVIENTWE